MVSKGLPGKQLLEEARRLKVGRPAQDRVLMVLHRIVLPTSRIMNGAGALFLLLMMFLTTSDVLLRFLFNHPIMGTFELVEQSLAVMVFFGFAYTTTKKKHIAVEVFYVLLPGKARRVLACISSLLSLFFIAIVMLGMFSIVKEQIASNALTGVLEFHVYPVTIAISFAVAMCLLAFLTEFLERLIKGTGE